MTTDGISDKGGIMTADIKGLRRRVAMVVLATALATGSLAAGAAHAADGVTGGAEFDCHFDWPNPCTTH